MSKLKQNQTEPYRELLKKLSLNDNLIEVILASLLALATITTAWSGYQASRWGGVQSTKFSEASALRTESTRKSNEVSFLLQVDIGLFTNWINAYAVNNTDLVDFYENRFRQEFKPAFNAWLETNPRENDSAPKSPFDLPQYELAEAVEADRLESEATKTFSEGREANQQSDDYILNTVILASVLFLSGIASKITWQPARFSLVILGTLMLMFGVINVFRYPVF